MTIWLTNFSDDPLVRFDMITAAKRRPRRTRLRRMRDRIRQCYDIYRASMPNVECLIQLPLTNLEREALLDAYLGRTTPLSVLRHALFQAAGETQRCCYCQIGSLTQLDHVVPKALHPEYAVLSHNLVPSCDECNDQKSDTVVDSEGIRTFLHLHGEGFMGKRWLFARFEGKPRRLRFRLEFQSSIPLPEQTTIRSHYTQLDLLRRFEAKFPEVLVELKEGEWDGSVDPLQRRLVILRRTRDPNYYKSSILEAMIDALDSPE